MDVGDIVVCIDDFFEDKVKLKVPNRPVKNVFYMVRERVDYPQHAIMGIRLEEIYNPLIDVVINGEKIQSEPAFRESRFVKMKINLKVEEFLQENEIPLEM